MAKKRTALNVLKMMKVCVLNVLLVLWLLIILVYLIIAKQGQAKLRIAQSVKTMTLNNAKHARMAIN